MQSRMNPYLGFDGKAKEAMEFYKTVFGGKLVMTTFEEGKMVRDPADASKIMHAALEADNDIMMMASDAPTGTPLNSGSSISISLSGDNEAELRGYWDKLSEGAKITMPLDKSPWGDTFGMLTDKFGTAWMVNITAAKA
jgi:PhnB protein